MTDFYYDSNPENIVISIASNSDYTITYDISEVDSSYVKFWYIFSNYVNDTGNGVMIGPNGPKSGNGETVWSPNSLDSNYAVVNNKLVSTSFFLPVYGTSFYNDANVQMLYYQSNPSYLTLFASNSDNSSIVQIHSKLINILMPLPYEPHIYYDSDNTNIVTSILEQNTYTISFDVSNVIPYYKSFWYIFSNYPNDLFNGICVGPSGPTSTNLTTEWISNSSNQYANTVLRSENNIVSQTFYFPNYATTFAPQGNMSPYIYTYSPLLTTYLSIWGFNSDTVKTCILSSQPVNVLIHEL
jgi:hypothetical protein